MSDFSLFSLFTAGLACLAPLAAAYTHPVGAEPLGNPIYTPGLNDVVPAGQPYAITWQPTTQGTVTLLLLKGPSTDAEPQYPIAQKIPNSGSYSWTPSTDLSPGETGYGIQLICDSNGQYQYSTQFGISNPSYNPNASHSAPSESASYSSASTSQASGYPYTHPGWSANSTVAHSTGWIPHNATSPYPTGHHAKPTWHKHTTTQVPVSSFPAPTYSGPGPSSTAGAAAIATSFAGLVIAGGVAVLAL